MPLKIFPQLCSAICLFSDPRLICHTPSHLRSHKEATSIFYGLCTQHLAQLCYPQYSTEIANGHCFKCSHCSYLTSSNLFNPALCSTWKFCFFYQNSILNLQGLLRSWSWILCLPGELLLTGHQHQVTSSSLIAAQLILKGITWLILIIESFFGVLNCGTGNVCPTYF